MSLTRKERLCVDYLLSHGGAARIPATRTPSMQALINRGVVEVVKGPPRELRVNAAALAVEESE